MSVGEHNRTDLLYTADEGDNPPMETWTVKELFDLARLRASQCPICESDLKEVLKEHLRR